MNQKQLFGQSSSNSSHTSRTNAPAIIPKKPFPKLALQDGFDTEMAKAECIFWHRISLGSHIKQLNNDKSLKIFMQTLENEKKIKQGLSSPEIITWQLLLKKNERPSSR